MCIRDSEKPFEALVRVQLCLEHVRSVRARRAHNRVVRLHDVVEFVSRCKEPAPFGSTSVGVKLAFGWRVDWQLDVTDSIPMLQRNWRKECLDDLTLESLINAFLVANSLCGVLRSMFV